MLACQLADSLTQLLFPVDLTRREIPKAWWIQMLASLTHEMKRKFRLFWLWGFLFHFIGFYEVLLRQTHSVVPLVHAGCRSCGLLSGSHRRLGRTRPSWNLKGLNILSSELRLHLFTSCLSQQLSS